MSRMNAFFLGAAFACLFIYLFVCIIDGFDRRYELKKPFFDKDNPSESTEPTIPTETKDEN